MTPPPGQRNPYKGAAPRPWLRVRLTATDGSTEVIELLADTGCPNAVMLGPPLLDRFQLSPGEPAESNFGPLTSGWLRVDIPDTDVSADVLGYGSQEVFDTVREDHPDFAGLVGLPVLRLGEYGGNATDFWFGYPPANPPPAAS